MKGVRNAIVRAIRFVSSRPAPPGRLRSKHGRARPSLSRKTSRAHQGAKTTGPGEASASRQHEAVSAARELDQAHPRLRSRRVSLRAAEIPGREGLRARLRRRAEGISRRDLNTGRASPSFCVGLPRVLEWVSPKASAVSCFRAAPERVALRADPNLEAGGRVGAAVLSLRRYSSA